MAQLGMHIREVWVKHFRMRREMTRGRERRLGNTKAPLAHRIYDMGTYQPCRKRDEERPLLEMRSAGIL